MEQRYRSNHRFRSILAAKLTKMHTALLVKDDISSEFSDEYELYFVRERHLHSCAARSTCSECLQRDIGEIDGWDACSGL
eukprot:1376138-Amorphochlora_amoeboformis.AAC.1